MSLRNNGKYLCDKCGYDVGNAAVDLCSPLSHLDESGSTVEIFHFCKDHKIDGKLVKGCEHKVLTRTNLKNYLEISNDTAN